MKYYKIMIDASAYFGPGGGSQFEGYPLPCSRLGSSSLSVSSFGCGSCITSCCNVPQLMCFTKYAVEVRGIVWKSSRLFSII